MKKLLLFAILGCSALYAQNPPKNYNGQSDGWTGDGGGCLVAPCPAATRMSGIAQDGSGWKYTMSLPPAQIYHDDGGSRWDYTYPYTGGVFVLKGPSGQKCSGGFYNFSYGVGNDYVENNGELYHSLTLSLSIECTWLNGKEYSGYLALYDVQDGDIQTPQLSILTLSPE